jgi:hypothetical protein
MEVTLKSLTFDALLAGSKLKKWGRAMNGEKKYNDPS